MRKKQYRFFGGLLTMQERWLNKMAHGGYRLVRTGKLLYEFETCRAGEFVYCVDFIGHMAGAGAEEYCGFLEDAGCRVFYKNINLNYSLGKIRFRPWAEKGGKIATDFTTFNRELLIVEKKNDGKPFQLHTTYEDRAGYCRILQKPYLFTLLLFSAAGILMRAWLWGVFAVPFLIPVILYQAEAIRMRKLAKTEEW